jgi:hypothetical protein
MFYFNASGIKQDNSEGVRLIHLSAMQGGALAQYELGLMYGQARKVTQNDVEAFKWIHMAAIIAAVCGIDIISEHKPPFWGFDTKEEWSRARNESLKNWSWSEGYRVITEY